MDFNIEFTCGLDNIDIQDLIIDSDNVYDYSSFCVVFRNTLTDIYFSADSMYTSLLEISSFIQKLSQYENDTVGELFTGTDYYSVSLKNKTIIFSLANFKEGFTDICFIVKINNENIQSILNVFNKLFDFKKKLDDSYVDMSDIEETYEINESLNS